MQNRWYHKLNKYVVENLAVLNAIIFIIIIVISTVFGTVAAVSADDDFWFFGLVGGLCIGGGLAVVYCGLLSTILTAAKDLERIANALEQKTD